MMDLKLIKTEAEYQAALAQIDALMAAPAGSREAATLELWAHLVEEYEGARYPIALPDPIAAIRFRMEQQGLQAADLVQYLGSKSRVSEVLHGKRQLTLSMIRSLHNGLGIPAAVLLGEPSRTLPATLVGVDWSAIPLDEMVRRRWFGDSITSRRDLEDRREEILVPFLAPIYAASSQFAHLRQAVRSGSTVDTNALWCWKARVWQKAQEQEVATYHASSIDERFIGDLAGLSLLDKGPLVAREMLAKVGIALIIEPRMPHTYLDGAAMRIDARPPIVALTLRHDRLDNFWFTLCHELAHVALHLKADEDQSFVDDLEAADESEKEWNADQVAARAMIPDDEWADFIGRRTVSAADILAFAASIRVSPAIVAGRYRKETGDYGTFSSLIGNGKVKAMFAKAEQAADCVPGYS